MVAVAQLVEPRFVVPVVVGSNPISHPIITNGPLAQPVEQGTLNPKVIGSIPIRPIIHRLWRYCQQTSCASNLLTSAIKRLKLTERLPSRARYGPVALDPSPGW